MKELTEKFLIRKLTEKALNDLLPAVQTLEGISTEAHEQIFQRNSKRNSWKNSGNFPEELLKKFLGELLKEFWAKPPREFM